MGYFGRRWMWALGLSLFGSGSVLGQIAPGELAGYSGWWLKNSAAAAFVIGQPYPRIVAFQLEGGDSPLMVSREYEYFGVRSWFFEPTQIPESGLPALQPATMEEIGPRALRLRAAPEEKSALQLIMEISLDGAEPVLKIRHGFKNLADKERRLAAWALNVIEPDGGVGVTPWRTQGRQSFLFWPDTDPNEPSLHLGKGALAVDYRILPQNGWLKVGTNTDAGWVAYVWDGKALKSSVAHAPEAEYPEDGGTITFFNSTPEIFEAERRFGEIENVGPFADVAPGETLWMEQQLEIVTGLEGDDPEVWVEILGKGEKP